MIMQADEMLYEAKDVGKSRFVGRPFDCNYVPSRESAERHRIRHDNRE